MLTKIYENPLQHFEEWFGEASCHKNISEANAVNLATASSSGVPSNRIVLLKDYGEDGFVFYTNLDSRKGQQLKENPKASMCFYWAPISKQIRIDGQVETVSNEEADIYFASRPFKSRIGAWASQQSRPIPSSSDFISDIAKLSARFMAKDMQRPPYWSGFRLVPSSIEFWRAGNFRLHKRLLYSKDQSGHWSKTILYP